LWRRRGRGPSGGMGELGGVGIGFPLRGGARDAPLAWELAPRSEKAPAQWTVLRPLKLPEIPKATKRRNKRRRRKIGRALSGVKKFFCKTLCLTLK